MKTTTSKQVEFSCNAPKATSVFVAGSFNDWRPDVTALHLDKSDGQWSGTLALPPGRYEYKFVIDGQWCCDPACGGHIRGAPNAFRMNSGQ